VWVGVGVCVCVWVEIWIFTRVCVKKFGYVGACACVCYVGACVWVEIRNVNVHVRACVPVVYCVGLGVKYVGIHERTLYVCVCVCVCRKKKTKTKTNL